MAISAIGVGSGLPLDQLLSDLEANERLPLQLIEDRQTVTESRISAYGVLKGAMEKLQSAGKALADIGTFNATKATVSGDALTVTSKGSAVAGDYVLEVEQLASHQMMVAQGQESRSAKIGEGGVIKVALGNDKTFELDLDGRDTSLNGLMNAINKSDLGIKATLINDGDPDAPYRLMLTAKDSGTAGSVASISVEGNQDLADLISFDASDDAVGSLDVTAANDALLTINGVEITSGSNTIKDVIEGVTLTLEEITTEPARLKITQDNSIAEKAVQAFVDAYNSLQGTIKSMTAYDAEKERASVLTGDSVARSIQTSIRGILDVTLGGGANVASLSQLGITTNPANGQLEFDSTKFSDAMIDNPNDVAELFSGDQGVGKRIASVSDPILKRDGMIATATKGMQATLDQLGDQYEATEDRITATMDRYRQQFIQLDSMVAQMNSVSNYLTQQLSMLENLGKQQK